ncbi:MAG: zinc ribbon domain-containing protein [Candidatus Methanomethylophilaceae archaeon]
MSNSETYDFCPSCGASIPYGEESCPQCGRSTIKVGDGSWSGRPDPRQRAPERSNRPSIAGVLMMLMGVPALLFGLLLIGEMTTLIELVEEQLVLMGEDPSVAASTVEFMVYGSLAVGAVSVLGGILAIMRRLLFVAIGCALVLTVVGLSMLLPGIIGIVCVVLLYQSRAEFA